MNKLTVALFLMALRLSATTIVSFEDLGGAGNKSDHDYNDLQLVVSGLDFHTTGDYTFARYTGTWAGSTETPLLNGQYFDYATVTGPVIIGFYAAQSDYADQPWVLATDGGTAAAFDPVGGASETFNWNVGDIVTFTEVTPYATYYNDPSLNPDGLGMMVVSDPSDTPEPGVGWLVGLGLAGVGLVRRRKLAS